MADSLVLTGVKQVTKHTGSEMTRIDAKRGGNTHMLPRWWTRGNKTIYVDCTLFRVEAGGATGYLAIEQSGEGVSVKIVHNGDFTFDFYHMNECTRGALYNEGMELVEHYAFPRLSGGKVMTVLPADAADRPGSVSDDPADDDAVVDEGDDGSSDPQATVAQSYSVAVAPYESGNRYYLDGLRSPELTLSVGEAIEFDLSDASLSEHPFGIYADASGTTPATEGVTTNGSTLTFAPASAGTYSYQCALHSGMGNTIVVS